VAGGENAMGSRQVQQSSFETLRTDLTRQGQSGLEVDWGQRCTSMLVQRHGTELVVAHPLRREHNAQGAAQWADHRDRQRQPHAEVEPFHSRMIERLLSR
jgi:hypothetical protein